jgi:hypothetical protein
MPARQRGSAVKRGTTWQARYRDENGAPTYWTGPIPARAFRRSPFGTTLGI